MTIALRTIILPGCGAEQLGRLALALLGQEVGAPTLLVAELAEDTILLGRHQRAASTIDLEAAAALGLAVARRAGGGKALRAAPGTVCALLAVPPGGWPEALPAEKVLNRCVRGLLRGLPGAAYFGRDFVALRSRQVAAVSQDGAESGTRLFEAILATTATLELPAGLARAPAHPDARAGGPPHACLKPAPFAARAAALVAGWASALPATPTEEPEAPPPGPPLSPAVAEDERGFGGGGPLAVPIGFVEALVRMGGDRLAEVRIRGDLIAPAFTVAGLEGALAGRRATLADVGPVIDAAFAAPHGTIVGLRELSPLAEAVLAAAAAPAR